MARIWYIRIPFNIIHQRIPFNIKCNIKHKSQAAAEEKGGESTEPRLYKPPHSANLTNPHIKNPFAELIILYIRKDGDSEGREVKMGSGRKTTSLETELTDGKVAAENGTMNGSLVEARQAGDDRSAELLLQRADVVQVGVRFLCMAASLAALLFMVTAKEASTVSVYGFSLPVYSKWSFSDSFE